MKKYLDSVLDILERAVAQAGSKKELAEQAGISPVTLGRWLNKSRVPNSDELGRIFDLLGVTLQEPSYPKDEFIMVPLLNTVVGAGASLLTDAEIVENCLFRRDFFVNQKIHTSDPVMMLVDGDSMEPFIKKGDTLLIDQKDTTLKDNNIYVVRLDNELMVKRAMRVPKAWRLCSLNPERPHIDIFDNDESNGDLFKVYGRVRWFGRVV